jgi:hypothetical protein
MVCLVGVVVADADAGHCTTGDAAVVGTEVDVVLLESSSIEFPSSLNFMVIRVSNCVFICCILSLSHTLTRFSRFKDGT